MSEVIGGQIDSPMSDHEMEQVIENSWGGVFYPIEVEDTVVEFSARSLDPTPPRHIVRRLKEYDPDIEVLWERGKNRWKLTGRHQLRSDERVHIMTVMNNDGTYRPLDERVIVNLMLADAFRYNDPLHFKKIIAESQRAVDTRMANDLLEQWRMGHPELYRSQFGSRTVAPSGGWKEFN